MVKTYCNYRQKCSHFFGINIRLFFSYTFIFFLVWGRRGRLKKWMYLFSICARNGTLVGVRNCECGTRICFTCRTRKIPYCTSLKLSGLRTWDYHVIDKIFLPHPDAENRQSCNSKKKCSVVQSAINSFFEQSQHYKTHWNSAEQYTTQHFSKRMIIRFGAENV
jgi:hypothetical protein